MIISKVIPFNLFNADNMSAGKFQEIKNLKRNQNFTLPFLKGLGKLWTSISVLEHQLLVEGAQLGRLESLAKVNRLKKKIK